METCHIQTGKRIFNFNYIKMRSLFSLVFFFISCKGQKENPEKLSDSTYSIKKEKIVQDANKTFVEKYIAKYIDSVNNATNEKELPQFLSYNQFDYQNKGLWTTLHTPISVRAQIINRVNNCNALLLITQSKNVEYKRKPYIEDKLVPPFIELSFYDLALKRLVILGCKEE